MQAAPQEIADARLAHLQQLRERRLLQAPRRHDLLNLNQEVRADDEVLGLLLGEAEIAKHVAAGRRPRGASISSGDGGIGCAHNVRSMTAKRSRKRVASVREYVASKPKESRASLEAVRRAILKALPNAQEGLAYQMPAYTLNGVGVLYFAGWKSHYSLYPASDALVEAFAKELAPYERSKGTLKFPLSEPVPVRLIERIAKFRARQLTTRDAATGRRKGGREGQVDRIRRICAALPSAFEKMSHGTPCFFVEQGKGCFAMFSEHHRDDGRLSLWVPVADGLQPLMIEESPDIYFYPRYVGAGGWVGILLDQIADDALESHLREARRIIASKRKPARKPRGM